MRLGIPRNVFPLETDATNVPMVTAFNASLDILRKAGAIIVENTNFPAATTFVNSSLPTRILEADFIVNLKTYLNLLTYNPNDIKSVADLQHFTQTFPLEDYPDRNTAIWDEALQSWNNTDPQFWPAYLRNMYFGGEGGLLGALQRYSLDAIIMPAWFASDFAATVGAPVITVPLGFYPDGFPVVKTSRGLVEAAPNIPYVYAIPTLFTCSAQEIGQSNLELVLVLAWGSWEPSSPKRS